MATIKATITSLGLNALGGAVNGQGLDNLGKILSQPMSNLGGFGGQMDAQAKILNIIKTDYDNPTALNGAGFNPLVYLSNALTGIADEVGSATSDGRGAISGSLGSGFHALDGSGIVDAISKHTEYLKGSYGANSIIQCFTGVEAFCFISRELYQTLEGGLAARFGSAFAALNSSLPASETLSAVDSDFLSNNSNSEVEEILGGEYAFTNFLGVNINNITDAITNGFSNFIVGDVKTVLAQLAIDFTNLGNAYDLVDIDNFGNPGQLVDKLISVGAGDVTGVVDAMQDIGGDQLLANIGELSSSQFNSQLTDALSLITNPEMIRIAQQALGSNVPNLTSLADLTSIRKVLLTSFDNITPNTFPELVSQLKNLSIGNIETPLQLGTLLSRFDFPASLPTIENSTVLIDSDAAANIRTKFLDKNFENIKVSDAIGSLGGVGIRNPITRFTDAMTEMADAGAFTDLNALYTRLNAGLNGDYTSGTSVYGVDTIDDPVTAISYNDMDAFVNATLALIGAEITSIAGTSAYSDAFSRARTAITEIQQKIYDESITYVPMMDLHLGDRNNDPVNVYGFATSMESRVEDPDALEVLKGLAEAAKLQNDKFGSYWDAFISETLNRNAVQTHSIDWISEDKIEI